MKKYVSLFLALLLALLLTGCGEQTPPAPIQPENTASEPATVRVTFPEGRTIRQYGSLLEENGVCSASDFYLAMSENDFSEQFTFLPAKEKLDEREYQLEGYLFPDTYDFYVGENPSSVIKRFLRNFEAKVTPEMIAACDENGLTLDQTLILASIVERESDVATEMNKIAMVFLNRLNNRAEYPKLQSDATKFYPYVVSDKLPEGFKSEYNTYDVKGLPKGPICNPSLSAINGSVYPDTSVDAYFLYTDVNHVHYYAKTYKEHLKNYNYCKKHGLVP